jgi:predicted DNA-binding transcriptional regulator AlpA
MSLKTSTTPQDGTPAALKHFDLLPADARVRLPVVKALFACSNATAWRMTKDGRLPAPRKSGNMTFWLAGELRAVLRGE